MYSPIVLEAFDALLASSPLLEESQSSPDLEIPQSAPPYVTSTDETSELLSCGCDPASEKHWYLHTRRYLHRQSTDSSMDSSIDPTESLPLKALLSPGFNNRLNTRSEKVSVMDVQVVEIEESKA